MLELKNFLIQESHNNNLKYALNSIKALTEEESLYNYYCSKIYKDVEIVSKNNKNINQFPKDMFIEQLLLCSMLGYDEFLESKWLKLVNRFQQLNGCFG